MTEKEIALKVLQFTGGEENISSATHCVTRLRFILKDDSKVSINEISNIEGVLKVQTVSGQFQVVLGNKVTKVYKELMSLTNLSKHSDSEISEKNTKKTNLLNRGIETVVAIFTPVLPVLIGCGMMKSLSSIFITAGLADPKSGFIVIFNMISDIIFYFMPFFLAFSAAEKFKTNKYLAVALAGALLHPSILNMALDVKNTGITKIDFLGLPILLIKYTSTVIPIILSVWVMSYVYNSINKIIPDFLKVILVPMLVLLIMVPLELTILGPFGAYIGTGLSTVITTIFNLNTAIAGFILGFFRPILVMFGMHYSIMPIQIQQIAETGSTVLMPSALAANLGQAGAAFGVFLLAKKGTVKTTAASSTLTGLFGITEPAMYGTNLKFKKPFFAGCLSAGIISGFFGFVNASTNAMAIPGVLSLGTYQASKYSYIIIGTVLSFILATLFTYISMANNKELKEN